MLFAGWMVVAKKKARLKYANKSQGSGSEQAPSRAFLFIRYTAARYLATVNRRHFRHCMLFQSTKTSIVVCCRRYQTPKTPASRVGLRSRPSIAKRCRKSEGDGRSSLLESDGSLAFSKALEAHMIPSQLNWRKHQTSSRQLPSPARFLCTAFFFKRKRVTFPPSRPINSLSPALFHLEQCHAVNGHSVM